MDNGATNSFDQTTNQTYTPIVESADPEQTCENDRTFKPSKIPVLKAKHTENANSTSNSDTSIKCTSPTAEEYDAGKTLNVYSVIPTSPITGKKYRSPLSALTKPPDRSRKITNGNISNNGSCDNGGSEIPNISRPNTAAPVTKNIVEESNVGSPTAAAKSETDSGRDTPNSTANSKPSSDASNTDIRESATPVINEMLHSERKPMLKWMFGPHKNANVVRIYI